MANPFFTIGHSVRPLDVFVGLLKNADVRLVVDVRTIPRSRTNPQYNGDTLPSSLSGFQIAYEHIAELGGRRGRQPNVPPVMNGFWQNESFHNYALRDGRGLSRGARAIATARSFRALRHHVRGDVMVAMSPADHFGLSDRRRRDCFSHSRAGSRRAGRHDARRQTWRRWSADLSG